MRKRVTLGAEGAPSFWSAYFLVANVDASRAKAIALGATPFGEPFDVPGMGRGAVLADPGGAVFNLWQSDASAGGDFAMFEDHSIGWVELATRDVDAAQRFYGELLGWIFRDSANAPGVGRIARIDDPTGAGLYLIELAR
ncbi:MAG: hypothetical protein ACK5US_01155 [Lysobacteraceae bacterium]